jgi:DNA-binding NtrC family response regulator
MSPSPAERLIFAGQFKDAFELLNGKTMLQPLERALKAWAELELGRLDDASADASAVLTAPTNARARAFATMVSGKVLGRQGSLEQAVALTRKAVAEIANCDRSLEPEFLAHHIHSLFWVGIEPAFAELPRLRQIAVATGNRNALIEYHLGRARVAAFRRLRPLAAQEATIAETLSEGHPNLDQRWRIREIQAHLALLDSNLVEARALYDECFRTATEMGLANRATYATANLAHVCVRIGLFDEAKRLVAKANTGFPTFSRGRFGILNTGVHLGIASRDHELAGAILREAQSALDVIGEEQFHYRLWFDYQRARWSLFNGDTRAALSVCKKTLKALPAGEQELLERFQLLLAEVSARSGHLRQANARFGEFITSAHDPNVEVLVEMLRVAAVLTQNADPEAASQYLQCAVDILSAGGLHGILAEFQRDREALADAGSEVSSRSEHFLVRTGVLLQLGRTPLILGQELARCLESCSGVAARIRRGSEAGDVVWSSHGEANEARISDVSTFIGRSKEGGFWLCTDRPTNAKGWINWTAVVQLARAALSTQSNNPVSKLDTETLFQDAATHQFGFVVASEETVRLVETAKKLAPSNITVLVTGETGTGKELFARALHDHSPRSERPFIPFNCSAVSKEMLDAQLFGYRKGAFTGAADAFQGVIRAAAGGTLFLDEIGEVALDVQPKLLRFLESGEIHPLGEPKPIAVDVRVVAATNASLEQMVEEGRFREDLFYRLNVVRLHVPPLRERREEIPPLVQHYLDRWGRESHKTGIRIADETMEYLILFRWPGNVRQLANEIRRMVALAESNAVLMPEHLSPEIAASRRTIPASDRFIAPTEFVVRMDQPMSAAVDHLERSMIQYALKLSGGRMEDAADRLGLSRKGLYLKRQRLALQDAAADGESILSA